MVTSLVLSSLVAIVAAPQDARPVFDSIGTHQQQRWETVRNYTVVQRIQGQQVPLYHERVVLDGESAFRIVPQAEWERSRTGETQEQTVQKAELMAEGLDSIGDAHVREVGGPMGAHIKSMTNDMSFFLRQVKKYDEDETRADPAEARTMAAAFARRARVVERVPLGGRTAIVIRADDLSDVRLEQPEGDAEFKLSTVTMWIDAQHYVPLRLRMEGRMASGGGPVVIELLEQDYRKFGPLYEPTRRIMRLQGMMEAAATDPRKRKEMEKNRQAAEKARADLAKMDAQIAAMPPAQRKMIEGRVEKARKQLEMMTSGDAIEVEVELEVIGINEGPPLNWKPTS
jgi:hypothetical protein